MSTATNFEPRITRYNTQNSKFGICFSSARFDPTCRN